MILKMIKKVKKILTVPNSTTKKMNLKMIKKVKKLLKKKPIKPH